MKTIEQQMKEIIESINSGKGGMHLIIVNDDTGEIERIEADTSPEDMAEIIKSYP